MWPSSSGPSEIAEGLQQARRLLAQLSGEADAPAAARADLPDPVIQALMQAQSAADLLAAVGAHPLLLRPEVDSLLAERNRPCARRGARPARRSP